MNLGESLGFAVAGIAANKMRAALTMLGILIGVASVITLVAVGTGSSDSVAAQIEKLGANDIFVVPQQAGGAGQGAGPAAQLRKALGIKPPPANSTQIRAAKLTQADAKALLDPEAAPHVATVAPVVILQRVASSHGTSSHVIPSFTGSTPSILTVNNDTVVAGRPFTDDDYAHRRRLVLLGKTVANNLATGDPRQLVGQQVLINGNAFTVCGILRPKGYSGQQDQDDRAIGVGSAVQDALYGYSPPGIGPVTAIEVSTISSKDVAAAQAEITRIMNARHHVNLLDADFLVVSASQILDVSSSSNHTLTILLATVAGISLLVGGIGVMNIMLVSVTERTREIGIRKAIGAGRGDIIGQFLGEAVFLSLAGGALGIFAGVVASRFTIAGVVPEVAPYSIYLALAVSLFTGLVFGLYPASRAADLHPIEALRYE
ncbi:MAG TPA: ABC transporter permease [Sporichthyaceae bacterium]|jgi:putative ABC transport system permease protein|nr:ABC transporter permease [Sporichthyaceae bacterium]